VYRRYALAAVAAATAGLTGCSLTPKGTSAEKDRLAQSGRPFEPALAERHLPDLPAQPDWRDILSRTFLANGNLEASYFQWKAAVERIQVAGAYPNSDVSLGYSYMLGPPRMKAFDRSTFSAGFDASKNLSLPPKVMQAAKVALDEARAAGERFRAAKFQLQKKVLFAWADYGLLAEKLRVQRKQLELSRLLSNTAAARAGAGPSGRQQDLLTADITVRTGESTIQDLEAELSATRAMLNGLMARDPNAPLAPPPLDRPIRPIPPDDASLIAAAADTYPEVATLAREVEGRRDALELARLRWLPDINPVLSFTGSISQAIGAMITLPTTIAEIRGQIRVAQADVRGTEALLRQAKADRVAEYIAVIIALRNSERRAEFFQNTILPAAGRIRQVTTTAYTTGGASFSDMLQAQRAILDAQLTAAEARAAAEKGLVDLECCLGIDFETLNKPAAPVAAGPQVYP
jgi:cobalt-zinc-cadmium efflux system outer membrane protein